MYKKKSELIEEILEEIEFEKVQELLERLKYVDLHKEEQRYSTSEWNELKRKYNVSSYKVAKSALRLEENKKGNNSTIDSIKAEVYDIGEGEGKRKPSIKHGRALRYAIIKCSNTYKQMCGLRFILETKKALMFSNALAQYTNKDEIIVNKVLARERLGKINYAMIYELHRIFMSEEWLLIENDIEVDFLHDYISNISYQNLIFYRDNYEVLVRQRENIEHILERLSWVDDENLADVEDALERKRCNGTVIKIYTELKSLSYKEDDGIVTEEIISEVESISAPEMTPLLFSVGKLTPQKWNVLLLLIKHFEKFPKGKKMYDWLEMLL